jgi:hypothetical protein
MEPVAGLDPARYHRARQEGFSLWRNGGRGQDQGCGLYGHGHTIAGVYHGLIQLKGGTLVALNINGANGVVPDGQGSLVAAGSHGVVVGCAVRNINTGPNSGGLVGNEFSGALVGCTSSANISGDRSGGLVGNGARSLVLEDCLFVGE